MEKIKALIANTLIKKYKCLGFAGAARWRLLYWAYKITGWHIRHKEWDWVLEYLPSLNKWQKVKVLDVGATSSLFAYELKRHGYTVSCLDIRPYQENIQKRGILFYKEDISKPSSFFYYASAGFYDFIVCISVLEHIEFISIALLNMVHMLKPNGRLLLTVPTEEYAQGHSWKGFNYADLKDRLLLKARILEYTERAGQICMAIGKL